MKLIARCTLVLLSLFVLASTASRADSVWVGVVDLSNTIPPGQNGPIGVDTLSLSNITGQAGSTLESLTFNNVDLTINGVDQAANPYFLADVPGLYYEVDNLPQDSITSFTLTGTLSASLVTVDGQQETIDPTFYLSYNGAPLDTASAINNDIQFDVDAVVTPEPSTIGLSGTGLALLGVLLWSRRRRAQSSQADADEFFTGIA